MATRFQGYAARFNERDRGRDMIKPGAFDVSLSAIATPMPLFWQHSHYGSSVGTIDRLMVDATGLHVEATITDRRVESAFITGAVDGLSIGYIALDADRHDRGRDLLAVKLIEVSLVTQPMHPRCRAYAVQRECAA
ncbi:MAG: HK97 family phage prohead protease [Betaproteobacteria bacterium]|nr:HK97 family phage prohead protease [Betaproteobacteria bacterium]